MKTLEAAAFHTVLVYSDLRNRPGYVSLKTGGFVTEVDLEHDEFSDTSP